MEAPTEDLKKFFEILCGESMRRGDTNAPLFHITETDCKQVGISTVMVIGIAHELARSEDLIGVKTWDPMNHQELGIVSDLQSETVVEGVDLTDPCLALQKLRDGVAYEDVYDKDPSKIYYNGILRINHKPILIREPGDVSANQADELLTYMLSGQIDRTITIQDLEIDGIAAPGKSNRTLEEHYKSVIKNTNRKIKTASKGRVTGFFHNRKDGISVNTKYLKDYTD